MVFFLIVTVRLCTKIQLIVSLTDTTCTWVIIDGRGRGGGPRCSSAPGPLLAVQDPANAYRMMLRGNVRANHPFLGGNGERKDRQFNQPPRKLSNQLNASRGFSHSFRRARAGSRKATTNSKRQGKLVGI